MACTISQKNGCLCPVSNLSMSQMASRKRKAPHMQRYVHKWNEMSWVFLGKKIGIKKKPLPVGKLLESMVCKHCFFLIYKQNILYELLSRPMQSWTLDRWWKNFGTNHPPYPGCNRNIQPTPLPRLPCIPKIQFIPSFPWFPWLRYIPSGSNQLSLIFKAATGIEPLALPSWRKVIRVKISSKTPLKLTWNLKMMEVYGRKPC